MSVAQIRILSGASNASIMNQCRCCIALDGFRVVLPSHVIALLTALANSGILDSGSSFVARLIRQVLRKPPEAAEINSSFCSTSTILDFNALSPQSHSLSICRGATIASWTYATLGVDDSLPWHILTVILKLFWIILIVFWKMFETDAHLSRSFRIT